MLVLSFPKPIEVILTQPNFWIESQKGYLTDRKDNMMRMMRNNRSFIWSKWGFA